jgi:hypothetical protein
MLESFLDALDAVRPHARCVNELSPSLDVLACSGFDFMASSHESTLRIVDVLASLNHRSDENKNPRSEA